MTPSLGSLPGGRLAIALVRKPLEATAADLAPGYLQHLKIGDVAFIHLHLPSSNDSVLRGRLLEESLRPTLEEAGPALPILVGDFNCVFLKSDVMAHFDHKSFPGLHSLISHHSYTDAFHLLHPHHPHRFTFHRPGSTASRLDRAHIPPMLSGSITQAIHLATTSDHHAAFFVLDGHLAVPTAYSNEKPKSYWHLNVSTLRNPAFQ